MDSQSDLERLTRAIRSGALDAAGLRHAASLLAELDALDDTSSRRRLDETTLVLDRVRDLVADTGGPPARPAAATATEALTRLCRSLGVRRALVSSVDEGTWCPGFLYVAPDLESSHESLRSYLDWELGHLGDRHEDLAYCTHPLFGGVAEDGKTFLASGVLPPDELFTEYERVSGLHVDEERVQWFAILATYSALLRTLATPYRVARLGRSHQDILLTRLEGVAPLLTKQLVSQLEKVL